MMSHNVTGSYQSILRTGGGRLMLIGIRRVSAAIVLAGVAFFLTVDRAEAITESISPAVVVDPNLAGATYAYRHQTFGFEFSVTYPTDITQVGWFDDGDDGLDVSHEIGIWDVTDPNTPLVDVTIPSGTAGSLDGHFRYVSLIAAFRLLPGHSYVIAGTTEVFMDRVLEQTGTGGLEISPDITIAHTRVATASGVFVFADQIEPLPPHFGPTFIYSQPEDQRNFDARIALTAGVYNPPGPGQVAAETALRAALPGLIVRYDRLTGEAAAVLNTGAYLSDPDPNGFIPASTGINYVASQLTLLGLSSSDISSLELTDDVPSAISGATHLYWRQVYSGIRTFNSQLQVNIDRDGRVISINNALVPGLAAAVNTTTPAVGAGTAAQAAALQIGINVPSPPAELAPPQGSERITQVDPNGISTDPIVARLVFLPVMLGDVRLAWSFDIHTLDHQHVYEFTVDATTGSVMTRFDQVASSDGYSVLPRPAESPNHGGMAFLLVNPPVQPGSPFGWHDTNGVAGPEFTTMRGNNVHAYDDIDGNNLPPSPEPDCGSPISCNFPPNFTMAPSTYTPAAVTNLFYWNNVIHDVTSQYGFDSASGNFQSNTYGAGGIGGDEVYAEAQDGSGINNANFYTPPDGTHPRMQMFLWNTTSPQRDGDFDSGVITHEFTHGISNRLVGGPSMVGCLNNYQQAGEGISDFMALAFTHRPADTGLTLRPMGTYVLGQPVTGPGIRSLRYTTDLSVNNWTYESIHGQAIPHGVGQIWAEIAWRAYWALVDAHGFNSNIYDPNGGAGNQRMLLYAIDGLKNTTCSPTFVDLRDGIIQAAAANYYGEDVCRLWDSFAASGLGVDADPVGPNAVNTVVNGFSTPVTCTPTDVWVEDTPYNYSGTPDSGGEPDPAMTGQNMWLSRAIWVRTGLGSGIYGDYRDHQNPEYGQTNYVHVRVRNRSAVTANNTVVQVYWANGSLALSWPQDWTLAGTSTINTLSGGGTQDVTIPWQPPAVGHFCLLTRLISAQDPIGVETSNPNPNTRNNNNIAWRNVNVVDFQHFVMQNVSLFAANTNPAAGSVAIIFHDPDGFIQDGGEAVLDLADLHSRWVAGGMAGTLVQAVPGTTSVKLLDDGATISGLTMNPGERVEIFTIQRLRPEYRASTTWTSSRRSTQRQSAESPISQRLARKTPTRTATACRTSRIPTTTMTGYRTRWKFRPAPIPCRKHPLSQASGYRPSTPPA